MTTPQTPLRLCLATQNPHKVTELLALLEKIVPSLRGCLELVSLAELGVRDEVEEDGETFADNARKKAQAAHRRTGLWSLADDSGLQVDELDGAPGVNSAYYGGLPRSDARNLAALLAALRGVPTVRRTARFSCTLCLYGTDALGEFSLIRSGRCEGTLRGDPIGLNGFGYDPLFVPNPAELHAAGLPAALCGRTFAELTADQKNCLSHRTRAVHELAPLLALLVDAIRSAGPSSFGDRAGSAGSGSGVSPLRRHITPPSVSADPSAGSEPTSEADSPEALADDSDEDPDESLSKPAHDSLPSAAVLG